MLMPPSCYHYSHLSLPSPSFPPRHPPPCPSLLVFLYPHKRNTQKSTCESYCGWIYIIFHVNFLYTRRYLRDAAALFLDGDLVVQGKAIVAGFLCAVALAQTVISEAFNPFTPVHNVVYTVTGVPNPEAVAVATGEKPKAD